MHRELLQQPKASKESFNSHATSNVSVVLIREKTELGYSLASMLVRMKLIHRRSRKAHMHKHACLVMATKKY